MDLPLKPHTLTALCAPHAAREEAAVLIAELAMQGAVRVLDGGNRFAGYRLMQQLRLRLPDPMPAVRRVFVRRAFTCYQVCTLLEETPALPQPCLLLDLLATFQDENVLLAEASRLLERCLQHAARLAQEAPLLVTLSPPRPSDRLCLVERLRSAAHNLYDLEPLPPAPLQPPLL
jgi:hypothetical protein